ncbi:class I SAM-dependent methyltransferase [Alienimonas sp. DA493]|uniref:class I SAM-dependent methyltransferase n=1 Tax=Alienimonas sp. DA493 TaxID=3373605 RepID=UPI0037552355
MHLPRNAAAWDRLAREGSGFARVATDEQIADPRGTLDSRGWLPAELEGKRVLCLGAGGGWQSVLYAALGCRTTVVDLSEAMLDLDRREAARRGFGSLITPVRADMSALPDDLPGAPFDVVHQPVSACYVPDLSAVYAGVARLLRPDGLYIVQHKQPASLQCFGPLPDGGYRLGAEYHRGEGTGNRRLPDPDPHTAAAGLREAGCVEYLHTWRQLIGDLCGAGFVIEDLTEPYHADPQAPAGSAGHRARFLPPYVRIKARRVTTPPRTGGKRTILLG